jgi:hypothetical protein
MQQQHILQRMAMLEHQVAMSGPTGGYVNGMYPYAYAQPPPPPPPKAAQAAQAATTTTMAAAAPPDCPAPPQSGNEDLSVLGDVRRRAAVAM